MSWDLGNSENIKVPVSSTQAKKIDTLQLKSAGTGLSGTAKSERVERNDYAGVEVICRDLPSI